MGARQKQQPVPRRDDLSLASHHIFYEAAMLRLTADMLHRRVLAGFLEDAVLESFIIHFRNLYVFAYQGVPVEKVQTNLSSLPPDVSRQAIPRKAGSDVSASDYFDSDRWSGLVPPPSSDLAVDYVRAKKQVLHITSERIHQTVDPAKYTTPIDRKAWSVASVYEEVAPVIGLWMTSAPKELLDLSSPYLDTADLHYELPSLDASTVFVSGPLVDPVRGRPTPDSVGPQGPRASAYWGPTGPSGPTGQDEE